MEKLTPEIIFYLEKTFSQNPSDIAHLLRYLYYDVVRFDGKNWYHFKQYRWICFDEHDSPLGHLLRNDLVNKYLLLSSQYNLEATQISEEGDYDRYTPLIISNLTYQSKVCLEISLRISDHTYFQKIMTIAHELFLDKNFVYTLDVNVDLLGFKNGVFCFRKPTEKKNETHGFRRATHKDLVFMGTGYQYVPEPKYEKQVRDWFGKFNLTDLLPWLGSSLSGRTRQPPLWITNLNDETFKDLYQLLKWTFGDYFGEMSFSSLRKRKISKSETHTALIGNCKKRLVVVEQSDDDHPSVNQKMVDQLLTEEELNLRLPYAIDHAYTPQFSLLILSKHSHPEPGSEFQVIEIQNPKDDESSDSSSLNEKWKCDLMSILLTFF